MVESKTAYSRIAKAGREGGREREGERGRAREERTTSCRFERGRIRLASFLAPYNARSDAEVVLCAGAREWVCLLPRTM